MNRRRAIGSVAGFTGAALLGNPALAGQGSSRKPGLLKQSVAFWSLRQGRKLLSLDEVCAIAKEAGCQSVELVASPGELQTIRRHGLECALVGLDSGDELPHVRGFNNPAHWGRLFDRAKKSVDIASDYGCGQVIAFTGVSARDPEYANSPRISIAEGKRNCVEGLKLISEYAREKGVTVLLESVSDLEDDPSGQGFDIDCCAEIVGQVGAENVKLLFDVYHVQRASGDVISRIRKYASSIGHVHTAGSPGRGRLLGKQEIAYGPIFETLVEIGFDGYVGHEFLPKDDPLESLREAVALCNSAGEESKPQLG